MVQNSWSGEQLGLASAGGPELKLKAWATEEACRRIARLGSQDLDALRARAESRDFQPVPLGVRTSLRLRNEVTRRTSANVIGRLAGSDPTLAKEAVVFTAHHDHYGIKPSPSGENEIYNGALDNAAGVATMLAVAEAFASLPERPQRSILFASVTAEEQGLLGSLYLSQHPPVAPGSSPPTSTSTAIIWGRTRDLALIGLGKSSLDATSVPSREMQGRRGRARGQFPDRGHASTARTSSTSRASACRRRT